MKANEKYFCRAVIVDKCASECVRACVRVCVCGGLPQTCGGMRAITRIKNKDYNHAN